MKSFSQTGSTEGGYIESFGGSSFPFAPEQKRRGSLFYRVTTGNIRGFAFCLWSQINITFCYSSSNIWSSNLARWSLFYRVTAGKIRGFAFCFWSQINITFYYPSSNIWSSSLAGSSLLLSRMYLTITCRVK